MKPAGSPAGFIASGDAAEAAGPELTGPDGIGVVRVASEATPAERRLAELGVLLVVALWAGNFVVSKAAIASVPPIAYSALRFGLASLVLIAVLRRREGGLGLPRHDAIAMIALGCLGFGLYQILWTTALGMISAGDSALLIAATPVITALLAVAIGADRFTPVKLAGALVAFGGVALVVGADSSVDLGRSLPGDLLTLVAAACWATYTSFGARILRRHSPLRTTTWAVVSGTIVLAPLGVGQLSTLADPLGIVWAAAPAILYSGFLAAGLPNVAVFHAVKLLGPTRVTAFQFLVPALTVVLAALFLAEPIRVAQIVGGVVIVAGVLLTRRETLVPVAIRRAFAGG